MNAFRTKVTIIEALPNQIIHKQIHPEKQAGEVLILEHSSNQMKVCWANHPNLWVWVYPRQLKIEVIKNEH